MGYASMLEDIRDRYGEFSPSKRRYHSLYLGEVKTVRAPTITQSEYSLAVKAAKRVLKNSKLKREIIEEKLRERIRWAEVFSTVGVCKPYKVEHTVVKGVVRSRAICIRSYRIVHLEPVSDIAVVVIDKSDIYRKVRVVVLHS